MPVEICFFLYARATLKFVFSKHFVPLKLYCSNICRAGANVAEANPLDIQMSIQGQFSYYLTSSCVTFICCYILFQ